MSTQPIGSLKDEFPDKYLFAEDLGHKKVTLTIAAINKDTLVTAKGKKSGIILTFAGKKKLLVLNKTNACLINEIFPLAPGESLRTWIGKRITLWPTQCQLGGDTVDCIRVWGSPDLTVDKDVTVKQGLKRVSVTLHAVRAGERTTEVPKSSQPAEISRPAESPQRTEASEDMVQAWDMLGWTREEGRTDMGNYTGDDYLAYLNGLIDKRNAEGEF